MKGRSAIVRASLALALALAAAGCMQDFIERERIPANVRGLAKTDLDHVMDAHLAAATASLQNLMRELYALNPEQLAKRPDATVDSRMALLLPNRQYDDLRFGELNGQRSTAAMQLAFQPRFVGDRVFALMAGLASQMRIAYGDRLEFFAFDRLDAENLRRFNTNLKTVRLSLEHLTDRAGAPLLRHATLRARDESKVQAPSVMQTLERLIGQQEMLVDFASRWQDRAETKALRTFGAIVLLPTP